MPIVTEPSRGPRRVMIASHIATSAAAMNTWPLTIPPGRSKAAWNGTSRVHTPSPIACRRKPYDRVNATSSRRRRSSASVTAGGIASSFERRVNLSRLLQVIDHVQPPDDRVRLPVEILDPVQRYDRAVLVGDVHHHHDRRTRVGHGVRRRRRERPEDLAVGTIELRAQPRPRPVERRLRLERRRDRLARRTAPREEAPELVETRPVRLDQMVDDLLDRPLARDPDARGRRSRDRLE